MGESDAARLATLAGPPGKSAVGFLGRKRSPGVAVTRLPGLANAGLGRPRASLFASDDLSLPLSSSSRVACRKVKTQLWQLPTQSSRYSVAVSLAVGTKQHT
jgi:hypothetical protein